MLGLVDAVRVPPPGLGWSDGDVVVLLGPRAAPDGSFPLEGTRWATERRDHRTGRLPTLDFAAHGAVCAFVAALVAQQVAGRDGPALVRGVHDVSGGGLATALAEMAVTAGTGCTLEMGDPTELFAELPSRFVVATPDPGDLCRLAAARGIPAAVLGPAGGARFTLGSLVDLPLDALRQAHEGNLALALGDP